MIQGTETPARMGRSRQRVLLVDDNPVQLKLTRIRLEEAGYAVQTAQNADEALEKTHADPPDAILSDVWMGEVDGFNLCRKVRENPRFANVPVILLSAHCNEEKDRDLSTRVGATQLVVRTPDFDAELSALETTLHQAAPVACDVSGAELYEQMLRRNASQITRLIAQVQTAENRYRVLFEHASDAIALLTTDGVILEVNRRWQSLTGVAAARMVGRHIGEFAALGDQAASFADFQSVTASGAGRSTTVALRSANGERLYMEFALSRVEIAGESTVLAIGRDVTVEQLARQELAAAEARYRSLVERIPDVIWTGMPDGRIVFATSNIAHVLGYTAEELDALPIDERQHMIHPDERRMVVDALSAFRQNGTPFDIEYRILRRDGRYSWVRNRTMGRREQDGVTVGEGILSEINDRKLLEQSLHQAQKMEAIGQLTGGIAHDFNNILAAILTNSHLLMESLEGDPRCADANEIREAAERAASLTRQLLAFSRRQVLQPIIVDLNHALDGVKRMLCRVIGEDIALTVVPAPELGAVRVDLGQLEQVIMNLAVNARDAMPEGGRLTLETANVDLAEEYDASEGRVPAGQYVMLSVSDTGCGMDPATRARIFEPFFTTKEVGKGTGLGLSTCYGIVKQSGGHIWVYSERGHGSVFKIYLPRIEGVSAQVRPSSPPRTSRLTGNETILLVEDDERVRASVTRVLQHGGFHLLVARDSADALALAREHAGSVDLLLTDVVMPGTCGPDLAATIREEVGCKVLFMSGYSDHASLRRDELTAVAGFIQKPFSPDQLILKAREVLDA
jgi:PAS domain S-box-containing protein